MTLELKLRKFGKSVGVIFTERGFGPLGRQAMRHPLPHRKQRREFPDQGKRRWACPEVEGCRKAQQNVWECSQGIGERETSTSLNRQDCLS